MKRLPYILLAVGSLVLIVGCWRGWLRLEPMEVLAFVTGAWCVWLTVEENVWNWPIGVANSAFFVVVFLRARLFADMGLNVLYVILGLLGWYWWLRGGERHTELHVQRVNRRTFAVLMVLLAAFTVCMTDYLRNVHDAAPFWDAFTTGLSLVAQYMLTRKHLENWYFWMTADLIYIPLYVWKGLALSGLLYVVFFGMCVAGWKEWRRSLALRAARPVEVTVDA